VCAQDSLPGLFERGSEKKDFRCFVCFCERKLGVCWLVSFLESRSRGQTEQPEPI
jgi:hypothetical protein